MRTLPLLTMQLLLSHTPWVPSTTQNQPLTMQTRTQTMLVELGALCKLRKSLGTPTMLAVVELGVHPQSEKTWSDATRYCLLRLQESTPW